MEVGVRSREAIHSRLEETLAEGLKRIGKAREMIRTRSELILTRGDASSTSS
jgi:hypothetical protein